MSTRELALKSSVCNTSKYDSRPFQAACFKMIEPQIPLFVPILIPKHSRYVRVFHRSKYRTIERFSFRAGSHQSSTCQFNSFDAWSRLRSEEHTSELQSLMRISYA